MTWRTIIVHPVETGTNLISHSFVQYSNPPVSSEGSFRGTRTCYQKTQLYPSFFVFCPHPSPSPSLLVNNYILINLIGSRVISTFTVHLLLTGTIIFSFLSNEDIFFKGFSPGLNQGHDKWKIWGRGECHVCVTENINHIINCIIY